MKFKNYIFAFVFILTCGFSQAQITFETKVSKKKLGLNERLRVDFEMNQDGDNFNPPNFEGFRVVGGPNQAISNSYINGKRSYSKTFSYFLSPKSKGTFIIKQATIEIDGAIYKTTPVKVIVVNAVNKPKDGNNADFVASENVHLVAEISNSSPYLNEAITVVYKLYVSHDVSITSSWREVESPKYKDFWSQNIDTRVGFKVNEGQYKGEDYRYVILRKTVLFPQKTGKLEIEPLTLDVPIDVKENRRDIFGRRLMSRVNKTISAGSRTINVKPLPLEGRPDNFTGAVGNFNFNVTTNKPTLNANESLELVAKVSGNGNLKLFDLPAINLPSSLEVYEPIRENKVSIVSSGMNGYFTETYTVVPQFKGKYPIRPISFSYFDVASKSYKTLISEEIIINVESGPVPKTEVSENKITGSNKTTVLSKDQFKYIKLSANLESIQKDSFFKSKLYWWLLCAPFLLIPLFIIIGKQRESRRNDFQGNKLRTANRLAKKYLSEAKKNIGNKATFYEALERALHNYLKAKLTIETSELEKGGIASMLAERNVAGNVIDGFIGLLKSCEYARYTPASNVTIQQDYNKAVEVIAMIDKQIDKD
ncbi:MAG: hypothetical protein ACI9SJ_001993 [Flavobacteriaceae bacterium]|jgi:hypothetical protein|uniref:BatD family protein n=1 Tax=Candidatus Marifrigoribacter sp. Uisw_064 TaxID=3230970 RepID=UPI003AE7C6D2